MNDMRREYDNYPTPEPLAAHIVDRAIELSPRAYSHNSWVFMLEPGCGDAAPFAKHAKKRGVYSALGVDIRDITRPGLIGNTDFLSPGFNPAPTFDVIATNPPYNLAQEFVEKSLTLLSSNGIAAFLLRLGFLASLKRAELFKRRPPCQIEVLQRRPSFTGNGTDSHDYAVFYWTGNHSIFKHPIISWYENPRNTKQEAK